MQTDENREAQSHAAEPEQVGGKRHKPTGVRVCLVAIQLVLLGRLSIRFFSHQLGLVPAELPQRCEDSFASISWILFLVRNGSLVATAVLLSRLRRQAILFLHVETLFSVLGCFPSVFLANQMGHATTWLWYVWLCGWAVAWLTMQRHLLRLWRAGVLTDHRRETSQRPPAWTIHDRIPWYCWGGLLLSLWFMALPLVAKSHPGLGHELGRLTFPLAIGVGLLMRHMSAERAKGDVQLPTLHNGPL